MLQDWPIGGPYRPPIAVALAKHPAVDRYDLRGVKWLFSGAAPSGAALTPPPERDWASRRDRAYG